MSKKSYNTFKYQSFSDRIANLDIRKKALYRIENRNELKDEDTSYFSDAVQKWRVLNLTDDFTALAKELNGINTLAQLVHQKDFVVKKLLGAFEKFSVVSLQPLLELTAAVARDLADDFYEYFGEVFKVLTQLLETKDGDQLEWALTCLAHIFKAVKRSLRKNFTEVFSLVLPQLSSDKSSAIVSFVAECFAFITRDLARKKDFTLFVLRSIRDEHVFGCGRLFFEIIRGMGGNFHMDAKVVLNITVGLILEVQEESERNKLFDLNVQIFTDIIENLQDVQVVVEILRENLKQSFASLDSNESPTQMILELIGQVVEYSRKDLQKILPILLDCIFALFDQDINDNTLRSLSKLVAVLLLSKRVTVGQTEISRLCKKCLSIRNVSVVADFVGSMKDHSQFDIIIIPDLVKYVAVVQSSESLRIFCDIFVDRGYLWRSGSDIIQASYKCSTNKNLEKYVLTCIRTEDENQLVATFCLPYLVPTIKEEDLGYLRKISSQIYENLDSDLLRNVFSLMIVTQSRAKCGDSSLSDINEAVPKLVEFAQDAQKLSALRLIDLSIALVKSSISKPLRDRLRKDLAPLLSSPHSEQRALTTHIFTMLSEDEDNIYNWMFKVESTPIDAFNFRDHIMWMDKMRPSSSFMKGVESYDDKVNILRFLVGTLFRNFKLLWDPTTELIVKYRDELEAGTFWDVFKEKLEFIGDSVTPVKVENPGFESETLIRLFETLNKVEEEADIDNFRNLLLTALSQVPSICELKNRDIVRLYLKFYQEEFSSKNRPILQDTAMEIEEPPRDVQKSSKPTLKLLKAHLNVFLSMKNATHAYKINEVASTFKELLFNKTTEIQLLALKALLHCKCTYFKPLETELNDLTEDCKGTLTEFDASKLKSSEHRSELIDIVMRIVFAKLVSRPSKAERISYVARKQRVIQFLKRFSPEDIQVFFETAFHQAMTYEGAVPLGIAMGSIQICRLLADELTEYIGETGVRYLINVAFKIGEQITEESAKALRNATFAALASIFERYPKYGWSEEEVERVFHLFVWPQLGTLASDCVQSVSAQLKMILEWGKHVKYFQFLTKEKGNSNPMSVLMSILDNPKASKEVKIVLFDFISRLIVTEEQAGTDLLLPYLTNIIRCIKRDLQTDTNVENFDLMALINVAKAHVSPNELEDFVEVLIKVIEKSEDGKIEQPLTLLTDCALTVEKPEYFVRKVAPFFQKITKTSQRKLICAAAMNFVRDDEKFKDIIEQINALDRRWTDQPDYKRRLLALDLAEDYLKTSDSLGFVMVMFYQCFFFLENEKDIAMRDKTFRFLGSVVSHYMEKLLTTDEGKFLDRGILPTISVVLKQLKSSARWESLKLLGNLARSPSSNSVLTDLSQFCNAKDMDLDFFDKMTDIQENTQRKGLQRLTKVLEKEDVNLSQRTLVHFLMPVVTFYTCNERFEKKPKLMEVVIACLSQVPRLLTWNNYEQLLRRYLEKLGKDFKYQKQLINICVGILNAFHFKEECKDIEDPVKFVRDLENGDVQSNRVVKTIMKFTVPTLIKQINASATIGVGSKAEQRDEKYKQDRQNVLKLSLAFALIKLLQKLPKAVMNHFLQNIIYGVANFLKSSSKAVRITSRDILRKILVTLGPSYLEEILTHTSATLTRGNEVHVLTVTTNSLIEAVQPSLKPAHVDSILQMVLQICLNDIFRQNSGYKKEMRLMNRRNDAKPSKKSFVTLNILATGMSEGCMLDLVVPIKEVLENTHSRAELLKVQECFDNIVSGLVKNETISKEALLVFIHGILSESMPQLTMKDREGHNYQKKPKVVRNDALIIPQEPKRRGAMPLSNVEWKSDTNVFLLSQFGFHILHILLKRKLVLSVAHKVCLEALVPLMTSALDTTEVRIQIFALKCIACLWTNQVKLEQMKTEEPKIVMKIFELIQKFVQNFIARREENLQLIKNAFKALVSFFRNVSQSTVKPKQTQLLLEYVENEMNNPETKSMAFPLLRAIIEKKLQSKLVSQVMKKVANMSVYSQAEWVRNDSRAIIIKYLVNYPSKINQAAFLSLFCKALNNKIESTKVAASKMLVILIKTGPLDQEVFEKHWTTMAEALLNELLTSVSASVKETIQEAIEILFGKLSKDQINKLYEKALENFDSIFPRQKRLAVRICVFISKLKKDLFSSHLDSILSNLVLCLIPRPLAASTEGKFVRLDSNLMNGEDDQDESDQKRRNKRPRISDNALNLQVLETLSAVQEVLVANPHLLVEQRQFCEQFVSSATCLVQHEWPEISSKAAELLEVVINIIDQDKLKKALRDNVPDSVPFDSPREDCRQLIVNLCNKLSQLSDFDSDLVEKLLSLSIKLVPFVNEIPENYEIQDQNELNITWLCREIRKLLNGCTTDEQSNPIMKKLIYSWISELVDVIDKRKLLKVAQTVLAPLIKDMIEANDESLALKDQTVSVWNKLQTKFSDDTSGWAKIQNIYNALKLGVETKNHKLEAKKRKASEIRMKAKKMRSDEF